MWFSAQAEGRDGVTNMDVVASALAEVRRVLVVVVEWAVAVEAPRLTVTAKGLREKMGWAVEDRVVVEDVAVVVGWDVAVVVSSFVAVDV